MVTASQTGAVSSPSISSSISWHSLGMLILGWLSGILCHMMLAAVELPTYEVIAEDHNSEPTLSLWPMSQLNIALVPKENTTLLPHLCGFTSDGLALKRWPLSHRLAHGGTVFVQGEVRDLFSLSSAEQQSTKELVFVLSGSFSLCQEQLATALQTLDSWTQGWLSRRVSPVLGIQTLRMPVAFPHSAD